MYSQEEITPYTHRGEEKREQVEQMFNHISPTYDTLNHVLSLDIDRLWRKRLVAELRKTLPVESPVKILDVATGTADLAIMVAQAFPQARVLGVDISDGMMEIGRQKVARHGLTERISLAHADCTNLPQEDNSFDAVVSSFGLRNFQNLDKAYEEMRRVLIEEGHLVTIDLCAPTKFPMKQLFWVYKHGLMPLVGKCISHDAAAYAYLPASMEVVPQGEQMTAIIRKAGWADVTYQRLAFGMCILYNATKKRDKETWTNTD